MEIDKTQTTHRATRQERAKAARKGGQSGSVGGVSFAQSVLGSRPARSTSQNVDTAQAVEASGSIVALMAIENIEGIDPDEEKRHPQNQQDRGERDPVEHAEDLIAEMKTLQIQLLDEAIDPDQLQSLAKRLKEKKAETSDAALQRLINEVELRAKVELAKYAALRRNQGT